MNYGYEPTDQDEELAVEIGKYLATLEPDEPGSRGMRPYVEVDLMYPGVRVRRLTHYSDQRQEEIIRGLDAIYDRIVGFGDEGRT